MPSYVSSLFADSSILRIASCWRGHSGTQMARLDIFGLLKRISDTNHYVSTWITPNTAVQTAPKKSQRCSRRPEEPQTPHRDSKFISDSKTRQLKPHISTYLLGIIVLNQSKVIPSHIMRT
ncbi:hypothetical protein BT63DRAFT_457436 [Microthyrium microscopicum]|uniref:Uncharacterized protein n=1 Tax=Microthyrium microscopicum TaxID=703497 RepID=A0A6A6U4B3_9PEZI|nr:hypothetical protein BT63DRAFT_457436 [Microthyrium microscopicum]